MHLGDDGCLVQSGSAEIFRSLLHRCNPKLHADRRAGTHALFVHVDPRTLNVALASAAVHDVHPEHRGEA